MKWRIALAAILLFAGFALGRTTHVSVRIHTAPAAADGARTLTLPPPGAPRTTVPGNPAALRYVSTYWAQDIPRFNLSATVNAAAHRYHLSPVGLLAILLSECNGYTASPRCDHEWGGCDESYGATQVNVCTAAQFGVGTGVWDGHAGPNATRVRLYEDNAQRAIWLAARVLRNFKNASGDSFPLLAADWNCGSSRDLVYPSQCWTNHQAFLAWWGVASHFGTNTKPSLTREKPRTVGYDLLDSAYYQQRLWRLPATGVVESSTYDEDGLVGGQAAIRDTDALVPQWTHQAVYLPGRASDMYQFDGCASIFGSGIAALFLTPTDAPFALLHLETCPLDGIGALPVLHYGGLFPEQQDDATGTAFLAFLRVHVIRTVGPIKVHGGTFVGLSGWPSSYQYSNGSCGSADTCGIDAHLCEIMSQGASDWFLWLASGNDLPAPKPKPVFPLKRWQSKTRAVPAYRHGALRPEAVYWWRHKLPAPIGTERYFPRTRHRKHAYERLPLARHTVLYYWPKSHRFKVARR